MSTDQPTTENPMFSDFERLGNLLSEAHTLAKENTNYNPVILREYFSVLYEVFKFLYPMVRGRESIEQLKNDFELFNKLTLQGYQKLLNEKNFMISSKIFDGLNILHQELLIIKQDLNLGIRVKKNWTAKKRLENALE